MAKHATPTTTPDQTLIEWNSEQLNYQIDQIFRHNADMLFPQQGRKPSFKQIFDIVRKSLDPMIEKEIEAAWRSGAINAEIYNVHSQWSR